MFASDCGAPPASQPTAYDGYNARWTFAIQKAGWYHIDAWVPDQGNACGFATSKFSAEVHYTLHGPGIAATTAEDQQAHIGSAMVLWDAVYLAAGAHTLYLYDDASGGCACNAVNNCSGPVSARVFADGVGVDFQYD